MPASKITLGSILIALILIIIAIALEFMTLNQYSLIMAIISCLVCLFGIYFAFKSQKEDKSSLLGIEKDK